MFPFQIFLTEGEGSSFTEELINKILLKATNVAEITVIMAILRAICTKTLSQPYEHNISAFFRSVEEGVEFWNYVLRMSVFPNIAAFIIYTVNSKGMKIKLTSWISKDFQ